MASFASSATTGGARKHAWTKKKEKVGENNVQLRFVSHHGWRTQARLDQFYNRTDRQTGSLLESGPPTKNGQVNVTADISRLTKNG